MAQMCRVELETEVKSSPHRMFDIYKNKASLMPKISPDKLQSIQVLEGDGKTVGSVRIWTYIMGNNPVIAKDKIEAIDEKNNVITFDLLGGEVTDYFKNFKATFQATTTENKKNIAKWSLEYQKANENIPTPHSHLEFLLNVSREVDAYLIEAQKN